ncbi:MAG: molybdenum cofactor biosynthesis protein MoaE [Nitrososphaerota archaeon]|jgi:molybdopterin synthase catalytic subunit|nr:molybdenum cofactor biosynthesis protein MoaE [Nitrososphaerota archaeon]MDG6916976.1 molybdenum cofactor biosynthesis protein MoaE [Nitrososphaerota archaeon]MDG6947932.1 molybdenum cofactor biosynthesis protein MoaE [Nitrososphaerota archaeon]MDG6949349.1 molybdenum cofactor biosynthesis protein MoaE [Nitrososphaerota archaeon]
MARSGTREVTAHDIDPKKIMAEVADKDAGGTVVFIGTVRRRSEAGDVDAMEYQAYTKMAEKGLRRIEAEVREKWPVRRVSMVHREGLLKVGEVSVVVAVSSEHRAEAFEACRYAIDRIKTTLPIWKREKVRGKNRWVEGAPIKSA